MEKEESIPTTRKIKIIPRQPSQGGLSLKKLLDPNQGKKAEVIIEVKTEPFTQEELVDKWRKFAYSIKMRDLDLYSTLSTNDPILKDNWKIELSIYNSTQEADINNKRVDLLKYLRKQLNNTVLDLDLIIDKSKMPKGVFTEKDKYKKLVEKNPKIDQLRKKFGLSF